MSNVKYKMSNVNKVKLLSECTSGVPLVIFVLICLFNFNQKPDAAAVQQGAREARIFRGCKFYRRDGEVGERGPGRWNEEEEVASLVGGRGKLKASQKPPRIPHQGTVSDKTPMPSYNLNTWHKNWIPSKV